MTCTLVLQWIKSLEPRRGIKPWSLTSRAIAILLYHQHTITFTLQEKVCPQALNFYLGDHIDHKYHSGLKD